MNNTSIVCAPPSVSRSGRRDPRPARPPGGTGRFQHAFISQWRDRRRRHTDGSPGAARPEDALRALAWAVSAAMFARLRLERKSGCLRWLFYTALADTGALALLKSLNCVPSPGPDRPEVIVGQGGGKPRAVGSVHAGPRGAVAGWRWNFMKRRKQHDRT